MNKHTYTYIYEQPEDSCVEKQRSWEADMIVGLRVLEQLAIEWHMCVTEGAPPSWLLEGIPKYVPSAFVCVCVCVCVCVHKYVCLCVGIPPQHFM
jgi:hypothetical protein